MTPKDNKTSLPLIDKEVLSCLEVVTETGDYIAYVLTHDYIEQYDANYIIVNKKYCVVEAMYGALFACLQAIKVLQTNLDEERPKPKLHTVN